MNSLINFIKDFRERSGVYLFSTTILEKLTNFVLSWVLILILTKSTLGQFTYAQSVLLFFFSMAGMGSNSALLQIGSQLKGYLQRYYLISYAFTLGMLANVFLIVIALITAYLVSLQREIVLAFFFLLALQIIPQYLNSFQATWFRFNFKNRKLAQFEWIKIVLQFVISLVLMYFFSVYGYLVAYIIVPVIMFFTFRINFPIQLSLQWRLKEFSADYFWKFSIFSGLSNVISQLVFVADALIIFQLLGDVDNANYRVASIIPFNLLFIPIVFMKADYATIAAHKNNRNFLINYFKNYIIVFVLMAIGIFVFGYFFGDYILQFFGSKYKPYPIFLVLLFASCISIILRVPLGNIISALGKSSFNFYTALLTLIIDVGLNYYFIPKMGLIGAAYATAIALICSGIFSLCYFLWYVKKLKINEN